MSGFSGYYGAMRASRLLSILMLLQHRGRLTAEALAAEFEVSVRTVYRDIDQLSAAGVPVYADRGPGGGFQLLDGYRTRLTGLTAAEAESLFLAGLPGPAEALGLSETLAAAQLKLLSALPAAWGEGVQRLASRFHLDTDDWFRRNQPPPPLAEIARAVWDQKRLQLTYESWKGVSERTVEPLGLVLKAGAWYFVARVGSDFRTYRAANVQRLTTLDESFERPKDFDLGAHWRRELERFEAELERETATVRVSEKGLGRIVRIGPGARRAAENAIPGPDGWREAVIPIEGVDHAAGLMIGMGPEIEVLAPRALRARLAELAGEIAALNAAS